MNGRKIAGIALLIIIVLAALWCMTSLAYHQNASQIAVVQAPITGELTVSMDQGTHWLWGGHVTYYPRRGQIDFDGKTSEGSDNTLHIPELDIRFNDGAEAKISGSLAWEMPTDIKQVISLHKLYGSPEAIERQIIVKNIGKAVYMTGPLMSSAESYASRRNDLLSLVYDQVEHGAFKTTSKDMRVVDTITGQEKTTRIVEIAVDSKGVQIREDVSLISESGLHTFNLTLDGIKYPPTVESQIANQQQSIMAVQTAIAKSKTAEQDALTTAKQGEADAAKQKWEQEAIKAKEVTIAEKNLQVARLTAMAELTNAVINAQKSLMEATLAAQAAEQTKSAQIALGEGEAKRAQLVMQANGALEQKLAAWTKVNETYANAIATYKGNWVPQTVFGVSSTANSAGGGASTLIDMLTVKTARDLNLDMSTAQGPAQGLPVKTN